MTYPHHDRRIAASGSKRERVADLVRRYPQITKEEAIEIIAFMRTGRHLDIGLLTSDEEIRPKLDAFMDDHKADFRVRWWESAAVIGTIAVFLMTFWLVWEALA
jgi:hypothetical protein